MVFIGFFNGVLESFYGFFLGFPEVFLGIFFHEVFLVLFLWGFPRVFF